MGRRDANEQLPYARLVEFQLLRTERWVRRHAPSVRDGFLAGAGLDARTPLSGGVFGERGWRRHSFAILAKAVDMERDGLADEPFSFGQSFPHKNMPGETRHGGALAYGNTFDNQA
jgi:hypothetical protein